MAARRISIGPGEVAGYFSRLKGGFDELGVPCEHFELINHEFEYSAEKYFLRGISLHVSAIRKSKIKLISRMGTLLAFVVRLAVFIYAVARCDIFIFSGFGSFFRFYELPILKFLGKKVLVVYVGSDARPPVFSGKHLDDSDGLVSPKQTYNETLGLIKRVRRVEKHANFILNHTATSQLFWKKFVRVNAVGTPMNTFRYEQKAASKNGNETIRIVHAPSRPLAKGSVFIRKIIEELRVEGYSISLIELVGVPNSTVLQELEQCDFVLDELYSDAPMGALATEAALFGKPVIVGGYYAEQYKIDNPDADLPPSLYVLPENIKDAIRKLIDDRDYRMNLGQQASEFIQKKWNARKVAENYLRLIEGQHPKDWECSPAALTYYWGWGLSKESWRKQVGEYVNALGDEALFLDHNPKLKQMVLDEIQQGKEARPA